MDYIATPNNDTIDQKALNLADGTFIDGGAGNDTITFGNAMVQGGAGNDTFIGSGSQGAVVYWNSPKGIRVDLAQGTASDGFGGVDTLRGVASVHGTGNDDVFIGNAADNTFFGNGGNDVVDGGAGTDNFSYYGARSTDAAITYDAATDTFTVVKHFANGDRGTDRLTGIESITFSGPGADDVTLQRRSYAPDHGFLQLPQGFASPLPAAAFLGQIKAGDFNGDGNMDIALLGQIGTGTQPSPAFFFLGDGKGAFRDGTAGLVPGGALSFDGGGRALVADFNNDRRSDFFLFNFGDDAPPFNGGRARLLLSDAATGLLADASGTLPATPQLSHAGSAGDVNGDGFLDLVINTLGPDADQLFLNDGSGHLALHRNLLPSMVHMPTSHTQSGIVDVDGDGAPDLILGEWDGSPTGSYVLLNDGHGDFTKRAPVSLPHSGVDKEIILDVQQIDLNHDGRPDLMLSVTNGGQGADFYQTAHIQLLVNKGGGQFEDQTEARLPAAVQATFGTGGWIMSLARVDMDRDGNDDIFATSASASIASFVLMNKGDGTFAKTWTSAPDGRGVALDVNNDGMTDLVTYTGRDRPVAVELNVMGSHATGTAGNDRFTATSGSDQFDGGAGLDVLRVAGSRAQYQVTKTATGFALAESGHAWNTDAARAVERLVFDDGAIALDADGTGGQAYRLYQAAFDRTPDQGGLGYWMGVLDRGAALGAVAASFVQSGEFQALYGDHPANADVVRHFYGNVLHRPADAGGLAYWTDLLDRKVLSVPDVLVGFSESAENKAALADIIGNGFPYMPA